MNLLESHAKSPPVWINIDILETGIADDLPYSPNAWELERLDTIV